MTCHSGSDFNASMARRLLKEFEREARADGMPVPMLQERKKALADQLNTYIQQRKEIGSGAVKDELFAGAVKQQEEDIERGCMVSWRMHVAWALMQTALFLGST
jgi:hypothetical protein